VLLMAVQLVSFYFIRYAIEHTAQATMREDLRVGSRVVAKLLEPPGLPLDDVAARRLQRLTNSEISFVQNAAGAPRLLATTLPPAPRAALLAAVPGLVGGARDGATLKLGTEEYEVLAVPIDDAGPAPAYAILQRSIADGLAAYRLLEAVLLAIAGLSLAVTLAGAMRIARRITRPVAQLGAAAREIERGNYAVRVGGHSADEIGDLGRAFDRMAVGLAERDNMRDVLGKVARWSRASSRAATSSWAARSAT
jgi:adenylate cyclase